MKWAGGGQLCQEAAYSASPVSPLRSLVKWGTQVVLTHGLQGKGIRPSESCLEEKKLHFLMAYPVGGVTCRERWERAHTRKRHIPTVSQCLGNRFIQGLPGDMRRRHADISGKRRKFFCCDFPPSYFSHRDQ